MFSTPQKFVKDISGIWYDNMPLGHNTLGTMMSKISEKAGLSRKYTNHSLMATAVNILDKAVS
jgi:mRNA-degrading endonuclease YafQ of YafQ-DinJ toxin-antitoxin module